MARKRYKFEDGQRVWIWTQDYNFRRATVSGNHPSKDEIILLRGVHGTTWIDRRFVGTTKGEVKAQALAILERAIKDCESELKKMTKARDRIAGPKKRGKP